MSVINQVLSDLEKRGASPLPGQAIRVVQARNNRLRLWLVVAVGLLILLLVILWVREPAPPAVLPKPLPLTVAEPMPVPDSVVLPVEEPVAPVQQEKIKTAVKPVPAMRLSYELSSIPLTAQTKPKSVQRTRPDIEIKKTPPGKAEQTGIVDRQLKQFSPQQRAENEFRRASGLVQKGRNSEALEAYEAALKLDATHDAARQAMVWMLLENKRNADAERVLQDGLKINVRNTEFAMLLARLQIERNYLPLAMETLHTTLPYADRQAEYHAFVAAVNQRMGRHIETIEHYQIALQQAPTTGIWQMGLGISLQALQRNEEARTAFKRAIDTRTLSAELQAFVEQRLKELSPQGAR